MGFSAEVGIDLGTANVLVYIKGKGVVLDEPSVVAINRDNDEILAVGEEARQILRRTPANMAHCSSAWGKMAKCLPSRRLRHG